MAMEGVRTLLDRVAQDVRYGLRSMRRAPVFAFTTVVSLSLGIGAIAAVFSVFDGVLLRPLPYPEPERLVMIWERPRDRGSQERRVAPANFVDWSATATAFESIGFWPVWQGSGEFNLELPDGARRVAGVYVSSGVWETLRVRPALGRAFVPAEDLAGGSRAAILSHELWTSAFSADREVIGRTLIVDSFRRRAFDIVGVMPPGFSFPGREQVWLSTSAMGVGMERRTPAWFHVLARLREGVTAEQAETQLSLIQRRIAESLGDRGVSTGVRVVPLAEQLVGQTRRSLTALMAAAGMVLLIACANAANLLLARGRSRLKELAVRVALGAPRGRLVRQLLTENVTSALLAAAVGMGIAYWGVDLIRRLGPQDVPGLASVAVDLRVIGFTMLVSILTALLFGAAPAWSLSGSAPADSLQEGRSSSAGRKQARLRDALVVAEVALALMLLVACGLLLKTLFHLQQVEPGFQPSGIVTARIDMSASSFSGSRSAGPNRPQVFTRAILERLRALPGVVSAAAAYSLPPSPGSLPEAVTVEGQTYADPNSLPTGIVRAVTPGYFRTIGARFQQGRDFSDFDNEGAPDVGILNEAAARRYFGHQDPLGQRIDIGLASRRERDPAAAPHWHEVIGVVENIRNSGLTSSSQPEIFKPDLQWAWHWAYLVVRTPGDLVTFVSSLREQVKRLNPAAPVTEVRTFPQILEGELAQPRFRTVLISLFGATALALAMAGVFGLQVYWVGLRTREFGIRLALGATRRQVRSLAVRNGMRLVSIGLLLGLAGAAVLSRLLSTLLYGVSAGDPGIYLAASAVLVVVALFSCWLPARNAASVDPWTALRSE